MGEIGEKNSKIEIEEGKKWPQILAILIVSLGSLTSGVLFMWSTPSIAILVAQGVDMELASYLSVIPGITLCIASPIFAILLDKIGRKRVLLITAISQFISLTITACSDWIYILYFARVFCGIADSALYTASSAYIGEAALPKIRGSWGNSAIVLGYSGNLLVVILGNFKSIKTTALILSSIPIIFSIGLIFIPDSPYFLIMKKEEVRAMEALKWLRRKVNVEDEFKEITAAVKRQLEEPGKFKDLFVMPNHRRSLLIAAFLRAAQQFSGISAISVYAPFIFKEGGTSLSPFYCTVIFIGLMVIFNVISARLLDVIGRRRAMTISCLACGILLGLESIYFYLEINTSVDTSSFKLMPIIGLSLYVPFFCVGLANMPSLMLGELFSANVKSKSICLSIIIFGIFVSICPKLFQLFMSSYGSYTGFGIFAICCFVSSVLSIYLVPDTQGKTLEEIQQGFKK